MCSLPPPGNARRWTQEVDDHSSKQSRSRRNASSDNAILLLTENETKYLASGRRRAKDRSVARRHSISRIRLWLCFLSVCTSRPRRLQKVTLLGETRTSTGPSAVKNTTYHAKKTTRQSTKISSTSAGPGRPGELRKPMLAPSVESVTASSPRPINLPGRLLLL